MKDVFIKSKIKNKDEELPFEGKGTLDNEKNLIQYQDDKAVLTIFLDDNIMLRETEDTILSYKFVENEKTNFEVFLKDLKQTGFVPTGFVPMKTFKINKDRESFEVIYEIEGNDFKHEFKVEWRIL